MKKNFHFSIFFCVKKWLSLGCRHPVEGRIFKILEFGGLNMLTLRIGPFWVDEGFWKNFEIFSPGHAWACPAMPMPIYSLYRAFYLLSRKDEINSKQVNSHFKVIRRLFRASFNEWQPSEAKGWSKNAFFHILTAVNMRNLKIGSFPEKTESVTS